MNQNKTNVHHVLSNVRKTQKALGYLLTLKSITNYNMFIPYMRTFVNIAYILLLFIVTLCICFEYGFLFHYRISHNLNNLLQILQHILLIHIYFQIIYYILRDQIAWQLPRLAVPVVY